MPRPHMILLQSFMKTVQNIESDGLCVHLAWSQEARLTSDLQHNDGLLVSPPSDLVSLDACFIYLSITYESIFWQDQACILTLKTLNLMSKTNLCFWLWPTEFNNHCQDKIYKGIWAYQNTHTSIFLQTRQNMWKFKFSQTISDIRL